jgi:hypothetical protein
MPRRGRLRAGGRRAAVRAGGRFTAGAFGGGFFGAGFGLAARVGSRDAGARVPEPKNE